MQASKLFQRRSQQVVEGLEEHVDPFDLDVFSPYLQANIMKATQRSAVSLCVCEGCFHACVYVCAHSMYLCGELFFVCVSLYVYLHTCVCLPACVCVCVRACVHVCVLFHV